MTDLASLVLAVDSSQVKTGTAALDGLTAAGTRAQAATTGVGVGVRGAAAAATAMAAEAQVASRAAVGLATSFGASANAAHINTMAMRETLVVARELSRGNFSRIPGSLTLLAQGIGSQGGIGAFASAVGQRLGLIKTLQNAELAMAAAEASASAQAIQSAAARAGANIQAADTELALAQAQLRVADTSTAEVAAQARLAAAHEAVAVAAGEGAIAENAFAVAQGRATAAGEASAAATATTLGATAGVLIGVGIAAVGAEAAFKAFQTSVDDTGALDRYAQSLVKTKDQLKELEDKVGGFQVTWGDVMHGVAKAARDALNLSPSWQKFKEDAANAFSSVLNSAEVGASYMYGVWSATIDRLAPRLTYLAQLIGSVWHGGGAPDAPKDSATSFSADVSKYANAAQTKIRANMQTISRDIVGAAEERISGGLGKPAKGRHPRQAADHSIQNEKAYEDQVARLDGEILAAKEKLAGTVQEQADFALQRIDIERDKTITDAKAQLALHKISDSEEKHLELLANTLDELKKQEVLRQRDTKLLTQQQAAQDQLYSFMTDDLKFADQMATTQAGHRKAQLEMLDIAYQQKAYDLQILASKQAIAGDLAGQAITQAETAHLPTDKAHAAAGINRNTMGPLEQWRQQFNPDQMAEDLQKIQVKGFDGLATAITGVITGTKSLKSAFKDLASSIITDIIQMTVKMLIFRAISAAFGGGSGGIPGFGSVSGFAKGGAFSGGNIIPFANGGIVSSPTLFGMSGGRTGQMGEAGEEAIMPLARDGNGRLGVRAANNNAPIEVHVTVEASSELDARISHVSAQTVGQAAPLIVKAAVAQTMRQASRPSLMGGR